MGDEVLVVAHGDGDVTIAANAAQTIQTSLGSGHFWRAVASSADGTKLVAGVYGGQIYTSTDSGVTWAPRDSVRYWYSVTSSSDGTKLAATEIGGQLYTSTDSGVTWVGGGPAISGLIAHVGSFVDMMYIGGGTWFLRGNVGGFESY